MASYLITIYVEDITSVITLFNKVRIYRSITGSESDRALYSSFDLVAGQSTYEWVDSSGEDYYVAWFTYYNSSSFAESGYSVPILYGDGGERYVPGFSFAGTTYPVELSLSHDEQELIYDIRQYIGDNKAVKREYVSPNCTVAYHNISDDGFSYKLENRGWPLKVIKDDVEYTSLSNPVVADYTYLTFSGTQISTASGSLDIWYESFRHSDREVLKVYTNATVPSYRSTATTDMLKLAAAIAIIRSEITRLMGEVSGSFTLDGELTYNPEPVLRQKRELLKTLQDMLDDLVSDSNYNNITGVRID